MRPSSVETSEPAWVNRKMLSMKSSTSWFWTSRKYSAMVSAERATRRRVPGGSSIWPKTRAVLSRTPPSSISRMRSLPSRVRSPTPENTEVPPKLRATRMIISWMSTVLPTPAPPNRPILPPCTYGVSRSSTLMPVSSISVLDSRASNLGADRWIGQRSVIWTVDGSTSSTSPVTFQTWPLVMSPTGTEIGAPVSRTSVPRCMPSVGLSAMQRTMLSPMCRATSMVMVVVLPPTVVSTRTAFCRSGMVSTGNSTSTTGPITRATRPTPPEECLTAGRSETAVDMVPSLTSGVRVGQGAGPTDDLADFLGDLGLPGLVGLPGQALDQRLCVVRRRLHRLLPAGQLRGRRLEQAVLDPAGHVQRQQLVQHGLGVRLELIQRQQVVRARRLVALHHLQG